MSNLIESEKILIRQLELGDEKLLHKWRNNEEGNLYCGFRYGFLLSEESFRLKVKQQVENTDVFPIEKIFIILKKEDLKPIGDISYRNWDKRNRSAEFGLEIGELNERGKGFGYEVLSYFIEFMFNHLNLNRIELNTLIDNERSIKLYKKLGFQKVGIMRESSFDSRKGKYIDVLYMDLLAKEWSFFDDNTNKRLV